MVASTSRAANRLSPNSLIETARISGNPGIRSTYRGGV